MRIRGIREAAECVDFRYCLSVYERQLELNKAHSLFKMWSVKIGAISLSVASVAILRNV